MMFASLTNSEDRRAPKLDQPQFVASVAEKHWRRKQSINQKKIGRFGNVPRHAQMFLQLTFSPSKQNPDSEI